jgi:hypothetical protein
MKFIVAEEKNIIKLVVIFLILPGALWPWG